MPELPEVEVVKQSLDKKIKFQKINKVVVRNRNLRFRIPKNFEVFLKDKNIEKFYLAILNGIPKKTNGIIISKIKDKKNKDAVTKYIVLKKIKKRFSFVLLKPETGRKRQIREHCFVLGCPILGDKKYFKKLDQNKNIDSNKLFLHAYKLKIIKKDGIKEEFTASLPDHIRKFCYLYKIPINETFINKFVISNILEGAIELKN